MVVILYVVQHFSMCGRVKYRDKLEIFTTFPPILYTDFIVYFYTISASVEYCDKLWTFDSAIQQLSFFIFKLVNGDVVASAPLVITTINLQVGPLYFLEE